MPEVHCLALGGGGFLMEPDNPVLDEFVLSLARAKKPRVAFVPTASGDADRNIDAFYAAFESKAEAFHVPLFRRQRGDLRRRVMDADIIYIGGGNTANMMAVWRVHGMHTLLSDAARAGAVLAGVSAGACVMFEACVTDSFGPALSALRDGLSLIEGSFCPHFDGEPRRRPRYRQLVGEGALPPGFAADDGAALHFVDGELQEIVTSRPDAHAYRVYRDGGVREQPLDSRYLGTGS